MRHVASFGVRALRASVAVAVAAVLATALPAAAQTTVTGFQPDCGAEGDPVVIRGTGFTANSQVTFDDGSGAGATAAPTLRVGVDRLLTRVPAGLATGPATIVVDGVSASGAFEVLAPGAPVILHLSATTVTPGLGVRIVGHRLGGPGATAELEDASGQVTAARAVLRRRAGLVEIPATLAAGDYTLRITNGAGLDTDPCSPTLTVVAAGVAPTLTAIDPSGAAPATRITLTGADLRPAGFCVVVWTEQGGTGAVLRAPGRSNGHDTVESVVPFAAIGGTTYDVAVILPPARGVPARTTNALSYTVGARGAPVVSAVRPDQGPAGSRFIIEGDNLLALGAGAGSRPTVALVLGAPPQPVAAAVIGADPGFGARPDRLFVFVPFSTAAATYGVEVTVAGQSSNANVTYTVQAPGSVALTVTSMRPDRQPATGPLLPVFLESTGFGPPGSGPVTVTWTDTAGGSALPGRVVFRSDRLLQVIPPGGRQNPLPVGTYTVEVTAGGQSATAPGLYTVQ